MVSDQDVEPTTPEKEAAELDLLRAEANKLAAEARKLDRDAALANRHWFFEIAKVFAPLASIATVAVTLVALLFTTYAERDRQSKDQIAQYLRDLGEEDARLRMAAAYGLSPYVGSSDYGTIIARSIVAALGQETDLQAQRALVGALPNDNGIANTELKNTLDHLTYLITLSIDQLDNARNRLAKATYLSAETANADEKPELRELTNTLEHSVLARRHAAISIAYKLAQTQNCALEAGCDACPIDVSSIPLQGFSFVGLDYDLCGARFQDASADSADFSRTEIENANFRNADLSGGKFVDAILSGSDFSGAQLQAADLDRATLTGSNFSNADFFYEAKPGYREKNRRIASFNEAILSGADFRCAELQDADFKENARNSEKTDTGPESPGPIFIDANLFDARFFNSALEGADFSGANLTKVDFSIVQLNEANFTGANLGGAQFSASNLENAFFTGARLVSAKFTKVINLSNADFAGAKLSHVVFEDADLINVNFNGADLGGTEFRLSQMSNATFRGACLQSADFSGAYGLSVDQFDGAYIQDATFSDEFLQDLRSRGAAKDNAPCPEKFSKLSKLRLAKSITSEVRRKERCEKIAAELALQHRHEIHGRSYDGAQ
jgi:uncharacterized protein YjbI with pentapeptide repeats